MIISKKRFMEELAKARDEVEQRHYEQEQNDQREREIYELRKSVLKIELRVDALEGKPQMPTTEVTSV